MTKITDAIFECPRTGASMTLAKCRACKFHEKCDTETDIKILVFSAQDIFAGKARAKPLNGGVMQCVY